MERGTEMQMGYLIPANDLEEAGLLCAACRGVLGRFIEDGRIILEVRDDEDEMDEEGDEDEKLWDTLLEHLPEALCELLEGFGISPKIILNVFVKEGGHEK